MGDGQKCVSEIENDQPDEEIAPVMCAFTGHIDKVGGEHQDRDGKGDPMFVPPPTGGEAVNECAHDRIGNDIPETGEGENQPHGCQPQTDFFGKEGWQIDRDRKAQCSCRES